MTEHDIEKKVKSAFTSRVPNVLDDIITECDHQKGRVITMTKERSKTGIFKLTAGIAAALVLVFAGVLGIRSYQTNFSVASTVSLDVNPSIEIKTNQKEIVLEVNALNEDGRTVIGEMNLKGGSIDTVVNAIVGSMLRNGYLNDISNSILVSVYGKNGKSSSALQEKLTTEINQMLKTDSFNGAVLSQTITPDSELQALADSCGISLGKARLIRQVVSQQPEYSLEELSELTINELNLMSKINGFALDNVEVVGTASDKAYIGIFKAKEAAFAQAGVSSESDVSKLEIEMDYEHGIMIYEVSFIYNGYKYNYDIDACSGGVTGTKVNPVDDKGKDEKDKSDSKDKLPSDNSDINSSTDDGSVSNNSANNENNNASYIGSDKAKEIAFSYAGVPSESSVSKLEIETDYKHGIMIYEVSFSYNNRKYNYDIDAGTGIIIETKISPMEDKVNSESNNTSDYYPSPDTSSDIGSNNINNIGTNRAKEIAFSSAGVTSESSVSKLEIETDYDHGVLIYEVEFTYNGYEYEYEIDASNGTVTKAKIEPIEDKTASDNENQKPSKSDKYNTKNPETNSENFIGESAAKTAALSHFKISAEDITNYSCETYVKKGTAVYKIKFISDGYEYSCDVDSNSSEIVRACSHKPK